METLETTPLNKVVIDNPNNQIEFSVDVSGSSSVEQLVIKDGVIEPTTNNDIDLGSSSKEFKDLYIDGTAYVDAINYDGTAITATAAELNLMDGGTSAGTTAVAGGDGIVTNDAGTMRQTKSIHSTPIWPQQPKPSPTKLLMQITIRCLILK